MTSQRRHQSVADAVGATATVAAIVELLLSAVERHQIVERMAMIRRCVSSSLLARNRHLLVELLVMLLLHQRELIQLLTTSRSLKVGDIRRLVAA